MKTGLVGKSEFKPVVFHLKKTDPLLHPACSWVNTYTKKLDQYDKNFMMWRRCGDIMVAQKM